MREALPRAAETELTLERSAYGVKLLVTASGWTLITSEGLYKKEGETQPVHIPTAVVSSPFAVMSQAIVHWAGQELVATPLNGASPRPLAALEQMPRDVFASDEHFAWLERTKLGDRIVVINDAPSTTRADASHRVVYRTEHAIVSGTMLQDWVFFVESLPNGQWRLGAASASASPTLRQQEKGVTWGVAHTGRPPAFLIATTDLYYYDGPTRSVRRVTPDLQQETTVAKGVICSPMAITREIYCAQVGGVFSVVPTDGENVSPIRSLDGHSAGPITAIGASESQVVWVEDLAGKQLRVRAVRLP